MIIHKIKNWIKMRKIFYPLLKGYLYLKEIKTYKKKEKHIPRNFYIESTNNCNAKCRMCPHEKMNRDRGSMEWDLFKKIIDNCKDFEGEGLQINMHKDGEPLMDPLIFKKIKYAKQVLKKSEIRFNTNAMLLNEEKTKQLLDAGIDEITFSIDGASKETYEKNRVGLKYDVVRKNIERFLKLKRECTSTTRTIAQMVVEEGNEREIEEFKKIWLGKADIVYLKAMHNFLDMDTSIKTTGLKNRQLKFCKQPFGFMVIYWNGKVGLCCWDYDNIAELGDVRDNHLLEIYNNDKFKIIREAMSKMNCRDIRPCNKCATIYGKDLSKQYSWEKKYYSSKS